MDKNLEERVKMLEGLVAHLIKSDRYTIHKTMQFLDGRNIQTGNANGTIVATDELQKLGFWGRTPVVRPTKIDNPSGAGAAGVDSPARTAIISILNLLEEIGLMEPQ